MASIVLRGMHREALETIISLAAREVWLVCPFIQRDTAEWVRGLVVSRSKMPALRILTTPPLEQPANDPQAVLLLLDVPGCEVRCLRPLHAKVYLADRTAALVTSANLSKSALDKIYECGMLLDAAGDLETIAAYIASMWQDAQAPNRDVLVKLAEVYQRPTRNLGASDSSEFVLDPYQSRRTECRYLAERNAFDLVRGWRTRDTQPPSSDEVMHFARYLNEDLRKGGDAIYTRFGPYVVNTNASRWAQHPTLFANCCTEAIFGDARRVFEAIRNNSESKPGGVNIGTLSALLYLRRHGDLTRDPEFFFYTAKFVNKVQVSVKNVASPNWEEYTAYCERCRQTFASTGLPIELWDFALTEKYQQSQKRDQI